MWGESTRQMAALADQLNPSIQKLLNAVGGRVDDRFEAFARQMTEMPVFGGHERIYLPWIDGHPP